MLGPTLTIDKTPADLKLSPFCVDDAVTLACSSEHFIDPYSKCYTVDDVARWSSDIISSPEVTSWGIWHNDKEDGSRWEFKGVALCELRNSPRGTVCYITTSTDKSTDIFRSESLLYSAIIKHIFSDMSTEGITIVCT